MNEERLLSIILAPHMSEKATIGTEKRNQYVFKVLGSATKLEIKAAVEHLFKAQVNKVSVVNVIAKARRFGQITGKKKAWKKAYVSLLEGQQIDFAAMSKI